jgi:hypothetical protein
MKELAVVIFVQPHHEALLPTFLQSLADQTIGLHRLDVIWILDSSSPKMRAEISAWCRRHGFSQHCGESSTLAAAIESTTAPWLVFCEPSSIAADQFEKLHACVRETVNPAVSVIFGDRSTAGGTAEVSAEFSGVLPASCARLLRRAAIDTGEQFLDGRLRPDLAAEVLSWRTLLRSGQTVSMVAPEEVKATYREPPAAVWRDRSTYDGTLRHAFLETLAEGKTRCGQVPGWLQLAVLQQLHWYFTVDGRERAPTALVDEPMAQLFHDLMREIMAHIEAPTIEALEPTAATNEVKHALLSYKSLDLCSAVSIDAYDRDQGLVRLTYWLHGAPPEERFIVDGDEVSPAFAKHRACNYFRRRLLRQRIVWLPIAADAASVQVSLGGVPAVVGVGPQPFAARAGASRLDNAEPGPPRLLEAARRAYPPGKGGQLPLPPGWAGWKVRLMKALARFPLAFWGYRDAWVFIDREEDADDNAEHLYRWVREHHPEVNAWFLLRRDSPDWRRLQAEGFRLMPPGIRRKLLILNSKNIISSHADYVFGGLDRRLYGDSMQWRYTFLQHGVIKDDLAHWLGPREFDCFVTSSPFEHVSVVGDDTGYPYTDREVRRTGLPRHDRLLRWSKKWSHDERRLLLVMPTWRGSLIDDRPSECRFSERIAAVAVSNYVRSWRAFLRSEIVHDLMAASGMRMIFLPHANALPYVEAFDLPAHVELRSNGVQSMQELLAKSVLFITDYSSTAFDAAFLRIAVIYYQFDQDDFYRGGHNWRPGYFNYEEDGFGPVAKSELELTVHLTDLLGRGCNPEQRYLSRMEAALPERDGQACERASLSILGLRDPLGGIKPEPRSGVPG